MIEILWMLVKSFLVGGLLCAIGQVLIMKTQLTSARILVGYVTAGVILGALGLYISHGSIGDFQPMNINFGIISPLTYRVKGKRNKNAEISARSLAQIDELVKGDLWNAYSH